MHICFTESLREETRRLTNGLIGVPIMNTSENTKAESNGKKLKRLSLGKIDGRKIGTQGKPIKTTAKNYFVIICSFIILATGILCPVASPVYADVPILTQVKTMAELILTLAAGAGTVITQPTIVNPIISEFGSADFQMQSLVDSGAFNVYDKTTGQQLSVTTEEAIEHIGDPDWLDQNNAEFKMDYQNFNTQVSAKSTLAKNGANLIHQAALQTGNPFEWDWGELIQTYLNQGKLSYELLFTDYTTGDTIIEDMGGILDNIVTFWSPNIDSGSALDMDMSSFAGYNNIITIDYTNLGYQQIRVYGVPDGVAVACYVENETTFGVIGKNLSNVSLSYYFQTYLNNVGSNTVTMNSGDQVDLFKSTTNGRQKFRGYNQAYFNSRNDALNYLSSLQDPEVQEKNPSPYLVNPILGNLSGEDLETISPSIETGKAILPFDQSAYQDLINDVNDNTNNNAPEDNPALVYPFIQDYIVDDGQSTPDPEPDTPVRPSDPTQPTIPSKDPITEEEMETNLGGTTVGLEEVFPFCIPFDIVKLIKGLRAERQAPHFEWTFESELFGFSYTFDIDLAEFNDVAAILRTMELIVFIIGLAVATRALIGAGG